MGTWDISSYLGHVEDIWGVHRIFGGGLSRGGLSRLFDHIFTHSFRRGMRTALVPLHVCHANVVVSHGGRVKRFGRAGGRLGWLEGG